MAAHLKECVECRAELARLEEVFAALDAMPVPDPGEDYGSRVWRQIAPRLPEKRSRWWEVFFVPQRLAVAGAVVALLIVAFYMGRFSKPGAPASPDQIATNQVRERVLVVAVGQHLGKSEMVLVELSNAQPASGQKLINIAAEMSLNWVYIREGHAPPAVSPTGAIYVSDSGHLFAIRNKVPLAHSAWPKFRGNPRNTGNVKDLLR